MRFEIRQDQLVAYRTYDFIAGTDLEHGAKAHPGSNVAASPIGAWPIVRHFDVIRSYNAATGEQTNVLEENDSDRPWNERGYIRVNWSTNLMSSFAFTVDGVEAEPATAAITAPDDPDAFTMAWRGKDGQLVDSRSEHAPRALERRLPRLRGQGRDQADRVRFLGCGLGPRALPGLLVLPQRGLPPG